ncbi:MAG: electron transport complex subunit RsxC, partial [Clostridium sp.]|nr:electron transport complex subunit RsxC [Clostridium sp.]
MRIFLKGKKGGSHPQGNKTRTSSLPIVPATVPKELIYPLSMHIGAPADCCVKVGDSVKIGTLIGEAQGKISARVHSSVSGVVKAIEQRETLNGPGQCIIIENDGKDTFEHSIGERELELTKENILDAVLNAGIAGMGGAAFPTEVKLGPPPGSNIDTLIINGAECEPYSTSDHRVMLEYGDEILKGMEISKNLYPNLKSIFIGIEDNKPDAIKVLSRICSKDPMVEIKVLSSLYPRGSEKNLIKALTNREVPPGKLPADIRCVVMNVSTCRAVYRAVTFNEPLYERVVSVSGEPVNTPKNLLVRIGTPVESLLEDCGGFRENPDRILSGGPMMGKSLKSGEIPVVKGMTAITVLRFKETMVEETTPCIMCGECLNVCPVNLQPVLISEAYLRGEIDKAKKLGAMDCILCGNCTYS